MGGSLITAPLPPCPLCRRPADRYPRSKQIRCENAGCSLHVVGWFPEVAWRRLAAPLAPEVVAVLRAVAAGWHTRRLLGALMLATLEWDRAGCPGLPEKTEKEK